MVSLLCYSWAEDGAVEREGSSWTDREAAHGRTEEQRWADTETQRDNANVYITTEAVKGHLLFNFSWTFQVTKLKLQDAMLKHQDTKLKIQDTY